MLQNIEKHKLKNNLGFPDTDDTDIQAAYSCSLAVATNPEIYTQFIPSITSEYTCLIIDSIFYLNKYQLCYDAAKIFGFNEPVEIGIKILPPLKGVNGTEAFWDLDEESAILNTDSNEIIENKIFNGVEECGNVHKDVAYQYLGFFEENNELYDKVVKDFKEGNINSRKIKEIVFSRVSELIDIFNYMNEYDVSRVLIG